MRKYVLEKEKYKECVHLISANLTIDRPCEPRTPRFGFIYASFKTKITECIYICEPQNQDHQMIGLYMRAKITECEGLYIFQKPERRYRSLSFGFIYAKITECEDLYVFQKSEPQN